MIEQPGRGPSIPPASSSPKRVTSTGLTELLDLSPDSLLVVDQVGTILQANEQTAALFGYRLQDMVGQRLEMLLPDRLRALHITHREHYFTAPRTRSMGAGLPLAGLCKDGTEFPVDISLRPVLLGDDLLVIGAIRDVSDQRRAERERAQQVEHIRQQARMIDLSHDAIFTHDLVGRVSFWNKGASEIMGTGLGLYLSRELVERHEGRLWFESAEGVGTTFFLMIPIT